MKTTARPRPKAFACTKRAKLSGVASVISPSAAIAGPQFREHPASLGIAPFESSSPRRRQDATKPEGKRARRPLPPLQHSPVGLDRKHARARGRFAPTPRLGSRQKMSLQPRRSLGFAHPLSVSPRSPNGRHFAANLASIRLSAQRPAAACAHGRGALHLFRPVLRQKIADFSVTKTTLAQLELMTTNQTPYLRASFDGARKMWRFFGYGGLARQKPT